MVTSFMLAICCCSMAAHDGIDDVRVIHETDTVWHFGYKGFNLYSRPIHRIDITYPSVDPDGNPITLSGYIAIPADVYRGEQPVDGIVLSNHYAQLSKDGAPTRGSSTGEDMVLANPLKPNYMMVGSDFIGFGVTEDQFQWFCYGDVNGQASIDCLLAAKKLLQQRGIPQGKYLVNSGYSSGGYDAIATQKVRDMKYRDQISFDRTVVGGLPFDINEAYDVFMDKRNEVGRQIFGFLMILDSYNTHSNIGLKPEEFLYSPWAEKFDEVMHSGLYSTATLKKDMKGLKLSEVVKDTLFDTKSEAYKKLRAAFKAQQLATGWEPDTTQNYTVMHLLRDETVPVESGRSLLHFLSDYKYNGKTSPWFRRSIIPEQTHLTTNFVINKKGHTFLGGVTFYMMLAATLTALPVLYYDGELNTHYADLVKDATPMGLVKLLEQKGYDLKSMLKDSGSGAGGIMAIMAMMSTLDEYLEPFDINTVELLQMADDSGLTLTDILEIYAYLTADNVRTASSRKALQDQDADGIMPVVTDFYMKRLEQWLRENNVTLTEEE